MTAFIGQTGSVLLGVGPIVPTDDRATDVSSNYQWAYQPHNHSRTPWDDGQLWTLTRGLGGQMSGFGMQTDDCGTYTGRWEPYDRANGWDAGGNAKQNFLIGQTLDQFGNPLGSCNVQGFLTGSDLFIGQVTSDAAGYYKLPTPYPTSTPHYLVCYLAGPPDVAGTSVNTLTPTTTG